MSVAIAEEKIQERAYGIYLERGGTHGNDQDDWFEAKNQLYKEMNKSSSTKKVKNNSKRK